MGCFVFFFSYNVKSCAKTVRVVNDGFCCMICEWIHDKGCGCQEGSKDQVQINPTTFDLMPNSSVDCTICLLPIGYDNIYETFVLSINRGYAAYTLPIHASVEKPHICVSQSFLDMGSLVKRNSSVSTVLYVENESDAPLYWRVHEYSYVFENNRFVEVCNCKLNANCGLLCHKGSGTRLEYQLDTSVARRFMSVLVFYTIYKQMLYESNHVIIIANIVQPVIRILNDNYQEDIFSIHEEYFVKETISRSFYIHNDSPLEVNYAWGEPAGVQSSYVSISFPSWTGHLFPWSRRCVQMTLTFLQPDTLHDIYVPLGVEALPDPDPLLVLHICCRVKPPQVIISIPVDPDCRSTRYVDVLWPLYQSLQESSLTIGEEQELQTYEHMSVPEWETVRNNYTIINLMNVERVDPEETSNLPCYPSDIFSYLQNISMPDDEDYHYPSEVNLTVVDDVNTAEVQSHRKSCEHLTSIFGSNTSICQYFIEFRDVACRQLCKKTIEITNIMDVLTSFSITIKNFKSKIINRKRLDDILINLNWLPDDKYTQQLSEHGIVVIIDPETSHLTNKSTVIIELQIYAETWGFYLEEISIEIEDLPIFYINVFIQVTGLPIEFPMNASHLLLPENTLRLGSQSICSPIETRTIFFTNNCTIPYTVVWHMFTNNIEDHLKGSINVAYDFFGFESEDTSINCKLRILSYFGKESSEIFNLFKIEPHETYIKPKETKSVHISFNPAYFSNDADDFITIEAVLTGNIYIEKQYQIVTNESNFVLRHPEKELDLIKIHVTADIEPGEIDLHCIRGERNMKVAVSDFLRDSNNISARMRLVFRNTASYTVVIGLKTVEPFSVVSVKSDANEGTEADSNDMYTCVLHADCCAEVIIQCLIDTDLLMLIADVLYKNCRHFLQNTAISKNNQVKITKILNIYQKCDIKQRVPISLTMAFPLTVLSEESLDFQQVRLGTEKKLTVKLLNKTASQTWFIASLESGMVFQVAPHKGYLNPALPLEYSVYLTVTFTPNDIRDYEDTLVVVTCVSQYQQEIKLTGTGTFNEKYLCDVAINK